MSDCKVFNGVTEVVFNCVKKTSAEQHDTVYDPPDGNKGTATTKVPVVGTIVVSFDLDPETNAITYCIVKKPFLVSASQVFDGIGDTINSCLAHA